MDTHAAGEPAEQPPSRASAPRGASSALKLRLVEAAAGVMARRGFGGASLADIALAAGLTKNQLLHYFPSKEALALAALEQAARCWRDEVAGPASMYPQGSDALRIAVGGLSAWVCEGRRPWLSLLGALERESALLPAPLAARTQELRQAMLAALRRHSKSAARSGHAAEAGPSLREAADNEAPGEEATRDSLPKARQRAQAALALALGLASLNDPSQPPERPLVEAWLMKLLA